MNIQYAPSSAEFVIHAAKIDCPNTVLPQRRGAHDAGLHGDVEIRLGEDILRMGGKDSFQCNEFGMTGTLRVWLILLIRG